jgi:YD repeat-containing protein
VRSINVTVPPIGLLTQERQVRLTPNGEARWQVWDENGKLVGEVWKSSHVVSPRIAQNSRIARHHKHVTDWRNSKARRMQWETRKRALADLLTRLT